jgi:hypothetical protein
MERSSIGYETITEREPKRDRARLHRAGHAARRRPRRWHWGASSLVLFLVVLPAAIAGVVKIERVSPPPLDLEVNPASGFPSISADGRFVAFGSEAANLVPGDTNNRLDVFVVERA